MASFFSMANAMKNPKSTLALFALPGFIAASKLVGKFGDRYQVDLTGLPAPRAIGIDEIPIPNGRKRRYEDPRQAGRRDVRGRGEI